jgi:hypothetical protein
MVFFAPLIGAAAIFSRFASAAPTPDSAIGEEVAVSAPNGIIMSDTAALATCVNLFIYCRSCLAKFGHQSNRPGCQ